MDDKAPDDTDTSAQTHTTRRSLSPEERDIIWRAHNQTCAMTSEPVSYAELQIDHIIPLDGGKEILAKFRNEGLVAADFDLNGTENLIPTKSTRNRQKGKAAFAERAMVYYLDLAARKKTEIDAAILAESSTAKIWSNLLKASADAHRNGYDPTEYFAMARAPESGDATIRFPLELSGQDIKSANSIVAEQLMDMPFSLAGADIAAVTGEDAEGLKGTFATPREFAQGVASGYQPMTGFEINVWGSAERTTASLRAIIASKFAPRSAIRFPRVTLRDVEKWSSKWITEMAYPDTELDLEELSRQFPTIGSLLAAGIASSDAVDDPDWSASYHWNEGFSVKLSEMLRADLDDDGDEEILVSRVGWVTDGTMRLPHIMLGKPDTNGLIMPIDYTL